MKKEERTHAARTLVVVAVPLVMLIQGCMVGPDYHQPKTPTPAEWAGITKESTSQPSAATTQPAQLSQWWQVLGDPKLTQLVEEALPANLTVQTAQARLRQAMAQRGVVFGALLPSIAGTAAYQREQNSNGLTHAPTVNSYQAGLAGVQEIDAFGGLRRNVESADASIVASQETLRDAQVTLVATVASTYVQLRGFQQQIIVARDNLVQQQHTAVITRQKQAAGFVSTLDVANADSQVYTTESTIPVLEIGAQQAIYTLSVLLARPPAALLAELSEPGPVPVTPADIPVGLPSELLRRRPDIRAAEAQLHAATAQIGVATADLFPQFSLTGAINWQTTLGKNWFRDVSRGWSFGPQMNWALFQGGSTLANIQVQEALRDQAFITYQQTVLTALQDVENALIALAKEQEHRKALNEAVIANRKAVEVSMQLYTGGTTDFINVLNAQRSLFLSEDALVLSQRDVAADLVNLYKALGGGWEDQPVQKQAASAPSRALSTAPAK